MSIKLRGGTWHCDFVAPDGSRVRRSLETSDKRQAQELHDRLKAEAWRVKNLGESPKKLFKEACIRWLREKSDKKSIDDDKSIISFWMLHFREAILSDITTEKIMEAVDGMENRRHRLNWEMSRDRCLRLGNPVPEYKPKLASKGTKTRHLAILRAILNMAVEWGWLDRAPKISTPRVKNGRIRWLTEEESKRLFAEIAPHFFPVVMFAITTGLRRSNVTDLEWSQVDLDKKMAWIHPDETKAGNAIGVPLNETACQILRKQQGLHKRWVFVHTKPAYRSDGTKTAAVRKMRTDSNKAWKGALKRAGISNFRFHDLRHTWASWLVQSGVSLLALKEMGGWETLEMVQRYAHLSAGHLTEHASKIDAIISRNGTNTAQEEKVVYLNMG
ncbi:site-specific integrase [Escherichia coli]|nr:site-specific integrase [Escherichia coli]EKJ3321883.1 site-specific integrase [Escherichia coli]ELU3373831.1 site-specific integrase [Escherichia coli]